MLNRKNLRIIISLILLALLGLGFVINARNSGTIRGANDAGGSPELKGPHQRQKAEDASVNAQTKEQFLDSQASNSTVSNGVSARQNTNPDTQLDISAKQDGSNVTIFTRIVGVTGGTCSLSVANGSQTISRFADILYQSEFSSCAGFSIPVSSLNAGSWNISVSITSDSGTALTKNTSLEVK